MKRIYAEVGFGNETFFSTEIEEEETEYRVPRFVWPERIEGYYVRIWIGKRVFVVSTDRGVSLKGKAHNKFKLLLGVSGEMEI